MKSALLPSVRVSAEARASVERVLERDETLSTFIERAVTSEVARRVTRRDFIRRGIVAGKRAKATGRYHSVGAVMEHLESILADAEVRRGSAP
ncbi:MAG: YlcI/YnfO family protein [Rhodanobacteraceae bacterium]